MINPSIFREYDIRGIADTDLVDAHVMEIGKGLGTYMLRQGQKKIIVGRDVRLSSPRIRTTLIQGLLTTGLDVIDVGVLPTPCFYFGIVQLQADGGVMITGSHNPIEFNGFKLNHGLSSIFGAEIQRIRELIEAQDFEHGQGQATSAEIVEAYLQMLQSKLSFKRKLKIVIDAGNGTASLHAPRLFEAMGHQVTRLFCEPDGRFPNHLPDPTVPKYMVALREKVLAEKADLGIGFDGDSDRIGAIDGLGRQIYADRLLALFSRDVLQRHPGAPIVFDVKCSQGLAEYIERYGGKPEMYKTGHSLLKARMKQIHAPLAGEMSGHIFFADDFYGFDDAFYAAGRLLQIVANGNQTLAELADEIPQFFSTPEIRVDATDEAKFKIVDTLVKYFKSKYQVIDVDGARVLFGDGWGLVRASNTQPVLVLRFEARTEEQLTQIKDLFRKKLLEFPEVQLKAEDFE